jgi:molybdopterin-containing oxidoreductase family iron-sulfur binding subunit
MKIQSGSSTAGRRRSLPELAVGLASLVGLVPRDGADEVSEEESEDEPREPIPWQATRDGHTPRWGMAIDLDKCTACGSCVTACRTENNVPMTGPDPAARGTTISWMDLLPRANPAGGGVADPLELLPTPCMHCDDAPCTKVCPVGATYQDEEGIVAQIWDRCIGCRYCQVACPYSRRSFNWKEPEFAESYHSLLNPDVATRPEGVVEKCTFCHQRIRSKKAEARRAGRPLADTDFQSLPACAQDCPADAITFGDLDEPGSRVARMAESPRAFRRLEYIGTQPKVFYLSHERIDRIELPTSGDSEESES